MSVPVSTSSCVNLPARTAPNFGGQSPVVCDVKDYSIHLRDRIAAQELQEDFAAAYAMCVLDPEIQRMAGEAQKGQADGKAMMHRRLLCLCCMPCWLPSAMSKQKEVMIMQSQANQKMTDAFDAFVLALNNKYSDRALTIRVRREMALTGVKVRATKRTVSASNQYKVVAWLAFELAEVEAGEKAVIKEKVAQGAAAAYARMQAAGLVQPAVVLPGAGVSVQVQPMHTA